MSSRWFIPASLAVFVGFIAIIWLYLAATQEPTVSSIVASVRESPLDRELDGLLNKPVRPAPMNLVAPLQTARPTQPPVPRRRGPAKPTLQQIASSISTKLDEASVQIRNDIDRSAIVQETRGRNAAASGDLEAALRHLDKALARNPRDAAALSARGDTLVAMERFPEAAQSYESAVRFAPHDPATRFNHAVVLLRLSRFADAAGELREVIRLKPDHADAHYNLAGLAQRDGRLNEARESWETFTRLRPDVASGWFNLGVVCMDFDDPKAATEAFTRATAISPDDSDGWVNLALAEAATGHLESALFALNTADELEPCEGLVLDLLAQVHELLAERDPAEADAHLAAAGRIHDLIGRPMRTLNEDAVVSGDKNKATN